MSEQRRGPGQPRIGTRHPITIPDEDWDAAGELAEREGISRAEWVRRAIAAALRA